MLIETFIYRYIFYLSIQLIYKVTLVLSISLDTFYSNKNYAVRKI